LFQEENGGKYVWLNFLLDDPDPVPVPVPGKPILDDVVAA